MSFMRVRGLCRRSAAVAVVVPALAPSTAPGAASKAVAPFAQNRKLGRGVTILGRDPIWRSRDRARYTACVARTAAKLGWSRAYRQFDADFIVYDIDRDRWVEPIHRALIP